MPAGRQPAREESASVRCSFRLIGRSRVYEVSSEALRRRGQKGRETRLRTAKDANPASYYRRKSRREFIFKNADNYPVNFRHRFARGIVSCAELTVSYTSVIINNPIIICSQSSSVGHRFKNSRCNIRFYHCHPTRLKLYLQFINNADV